MKLTRPLVTLDVETTGLDPQNDAIIQFGAVKTFPDGESTTFQLNIKPWKPIPPEVEALTGITNQMVENETPFEYLALRTLHFITDCDLCGFNIIGFDLQVLWAEFHRCGIDLNLDDVHVIDSGVIFKKMEERSLVAASMFYFGYPHESAHNALSDAMVTKRVLEQQLNPTHEFGRPNVRASYSEQFPANIDVATVARYCAEDKNGSVRVDLAGVIVKDKEGVYRYTHQKVRGVAVKDDLGYASWILRSNFSPQTHAVLNRVLDEISKQEDKQEALF